MMRHLLLVSVAACALLAAGCAAEPETVNESPVKAVAPPTDSCDGVSPDLLSDATQSAKDTGRPVEEICYAMEAQSRFGDLVTSIRDDSSIEFIDAQFEYDNPAESTVWIRDAGDRNFDTQEFIVKESDLPTLDDRLERTSKIHDPIHDNATTDFVQTHVDPITLQISLTISPKEPKTHQDVIDLVITSLKDVGENDAAAALENRLQQPNPWEYIEERQELHTDKISLVLPKDA